MKIKCSKCQTEKWCRIDRYEELKTKFGGVEKLASEYVCRNCKNGVEPTEKKESND